jgi:predicted DNA-binding antitoxin AbrB/MazE fold protein
MTTNLKAIYEKGILRLETTLPLPEGAEVDVTVTTHEADNGEPSQGIQNQSWDALTQLLAECAIDTGVPDFARQHDHYIYGAPKKLSDDDSTR